MMPRTYVLLGLIAAALATSAMPSRATTVSPFRWEEVQSLSQTADVVVTATAESTVSGKRGQVRPDGSWTPTTDTRVKCSVSRVYIGPDSLSGKTIDVVFSGADSPIIATSGPPTLLFLTVEKEHYRLPFGGMYGAMPTTEDGRVRVWFEGKEHSQYYTIADLITRAEQYRRVRVSVQPIARPSEPASGGILRVEYVFRNVGKETAWIMPPSYCFDAVISRRIRNGSWSPLRDPWVGVGHWDFLTQQEKPVKLAPGQHHQFSYAIPLKVLGMKEPGQYQLAMRYTPYTQSKWRKTGGVDAVNDKTWLGVREAVEVPVTVTSDKAHNAMH